MPTAPPERLERPTIPVVIAGIACLALVAILIFSINQNRNLAQDGQDAKTTLCVLRADYKKRITDTQAFLVKHPDGLPGIASKADLVRQIQNLERSYQKMSGLDCT